MGAYPQVVDIDEDGKPDVVSGDSSGNVWLFRNEGSATAPRLAAGVRMEAGGKPIEGVRPRYEKGADGQYRMVPNTNDISGIYSKIHVGDWDGDGLRDLIVGQDGPGGQGLVLYRNTGSKERMALERPVPIQLPGPAMARPSVFLVDWDGDGKRDAICGTERAQVLFFRNTGDGKAPRFAEGIILPLAGEGFEKGYRCRPCVADWNNDGKPDLLVGNYNGKSGGHIWLFLAE